MGRAVRFAILLTEKIYFKKGGTLSGIGGLIPDKIPDSFANIFSCIKPRQARDRKYRTVP